LEECFSVRKRQAVIIQKIRHHAQRGQRRFKLVGNIRKAVCQITLLFRQRVRLFFERGCDFVYLIFQDAEFTFLVVTDAQRRFAVGQLLQV